jgi:hypothetical protein
MARRAALTEGGVEHPWLREALPKVVLAASCTASYSGQQPPYESLPVIRDHARQKVEISSLMGVVAACCGRAGGFARTKTSESGCLEAEEIHPHWEGPVKSNKASTADNDRAKTELGQLSTADDDSNHQNAQSSLSQSEDQPECLWEIMAEIDNLAPGREKGKSHNPNSPCPCIGTCCCVDQATMEYIVRLKLGL